jgi:hypothetical protein
MQAIIHPLPLDMIVLIPPFGHTSPDHAKAGIADLRRRRMDQE